MWSPQFLSPLIKGLSNITRVVKTTKQEHLVAWHREDCEPHDWKFMLHTTTSVPAEFCHLSSWPTLYDPAEFPCLAKTTPRPTFSFTFTYTTYALYLSFISLINEIWTDADLWLICSSKQWFADVVARLLVKNLPAMQETWARSLGQKDSLEKGNGFLLQWFYLENSMDRGVWWAAVYGVAMNQIWLND